MARPTFSEAADATPSMCGLCGSLVGDEDIHARAHEAGSVPSDTYEPVEQVPQPPAPASNENERPPHGPDRKPPKE